jgi:hypothetical protein
VKTMTTGRKFWITLLVILGLWLVVASTAWAGGGQENFTIHIALDKTLVAPGDSILVTGTGAKPGTLVALLIVPDPSSGANALASLEGMPDSNGNFSTVITVPATTETGRYAVRAEQPPGYGKLVTQFFWTGICVNECTGQSLGEMLPSTGGPLPAGLSISAILSGLLVSALAVRGAGRAIRNL